MAISSRKVKNKRDSNGILTGKAGTVYDVNIKYDSPEGKKTYSKKGFLTQKEAKLHEAQMTNKLQTTSYIPTDTVLRKQTVEEYLLGWLEAYSPNIRPSTLAGYEVNVKNHINPKIGYLRMNQVTGPVLDKLYKELLDDGLAPATVHYVHRTLSIAFEHARKYRVIETNPTKDTMTKLNGKGATPEPYTVEQTQDLMRGVFGTQWEMVVVLGGLYGMRRGEILGLKMDKIDLEKNIFEISEQLPFRFPANTTILDQMAPTKSEGRTLPITELTRPFFLRQMARVAQDRALCKAKGKPYYDNGLLIAKPDGAPLRPEIFSGRWGKILKELELPHIRFHDLRHTAATNMHELTGDFFTVGEILGHTLKGSGMSLGLSNGLDAVTTRYVNVRLTRKKEVLDIYHRAVIVGKSEDEKNSPER